jgi:CcmD family protein
MENTLSHLFAGYAAIWVLFFAYLLRLRRREKDLRQELELLRDQVAKKQ